MTDFRALCAKMAEDIRYLSECLRSPDDGHDPICLSECESDYQEARTALAHPTPPAEGEVGELVEELRGLADYFSGEGYSATWINLLTDTADLLEQRNPAPVPVAERLPGAEDCDTEERCWLLAPRWILPPQELTHWLPATALPLPAGEGE